MGGAQSTEQSQYGFHVLKVKENSPAFHAGIEQFFDYIVTINGELLSNGDSQLLLKTLQEFEGKPLPMGIYSSKDQQFREITLIPSHDWHPNDPNEKSLIGCSIRFCSFEKAGENVWHVLDVSPNSPAEMAGIIPYSDYIIGSPHMTLRNEDDFYNLVEEYLGKPLRLYLYNSEWDSCRECIIVPNHEWGGNGSLGCDVGYGLLHRIPRRKNVENEDGHSNTETNTQDDTFSPSGSINTTAAQGQTEEQHDEENKKIRSNSVNYSDTIFNAPDYQQPEEEEEHQQQQQKQEESEQSANSPTPAIADNETTEPPTAEMGNLDIKNGESTSGEVTEGDSEEHKEESSATTEANKATQPQEKDEEDVPSDNSSNDKGKQD